MASIDHINLKIPRDGVEEALEFYRDVLGFEPWMLEEYRSGERTSFFFRIGPDSAINIRPVEEFEEPERGNFDHLGIVVDQDIDGLKEILVENGYEVIREGTPLGTGGRAPAVYVRDPFGYVVELKESTGN